MRAAEPRRRSFPSGFIAMKMKDTINLPRTGFPMKASLPNLEPRILQRWDQLQLYRKIRDLRAGSPVFLLHDGPPYANGNIHIGHAENKILKDFIVKSRTMAGFNSPYIPGWDCHGLPIEIKVDQVLGRKKAGMTRVQVRRECRKYAAKFVELQKQEFIRLGILGDWNAPYLTMNHRYEAAIARTFGQFVREGYVYKGLKPVHWCCSCRTALAEAEVEYEDHTSPSIYVKFPLKSDPSLLDPALRGRRVSVVIWTTTPWTLPANLAIAFNADLEYSAVEVEDEVYLIASELVAATAAGCGFKPGRTLATMEGSKLAALEAHHPFLDRLSPGLLGEHVTLEQGTGCVHTAPGHGHEDYALGKAHGLDIYCPVDGGGRFMAGTPHVEGMRVFDANGTVLQLLRDREALLAAETISHSYPHCWRCHKPVIFRATPQWFISMEHRDLRGKSLEAIQGVRWIPEWGRERISGMIANRPDWCVSRQRVWGVPITAFYCDDCQEPLLEPEAIDRVVAIFEEEGADAWFSRPVDDLLPEGTRCPGCGGDRFSKESDILDVWFDSGASQAAVLGHQPDVPWPADMYLEGSDQYRGWFHSSLLIGVATSQGAPYRQVLTHGWTLDAEGHAMSKSRGNVIEPQKIVRKDGAEILRLWVAASDCREDIRISPDQIRRLSDGYRKFRNTARFMLGNLSDFSPAEHSVATADLEELDQWALVRTSRLLEKVYAWYEAYEFHRIYHRVYDFLTVDLSSFYFDVIKDRLYTAAPDAHPRRSAQTVLYLILEALTRALAPIYSFTCEEIWEHLSSKADRPASVHMARFVPADSLIEGLSSQSLKRLDNWDLLIRVRSTVLKVLEEARQAKFIGNSLEAKVTLAGDDGYAPILKSYEAILPALLIVSQVELGAPSGETSFFGEVEGLRTSVSRAEGDKCKRCWMYSTDVGSDPDFPGVCTRCASTLRELGVTPDQLDPGTAAP